MTDEASRRSGSGDYWLGSDDYRKAKKDRRPTLIISYIGLLAGVLAWSVPVLRKEAPGLITAGLAVFAVAVSIAYIRFYTAERRWQERQESASMENGSGFPAELEISHKKMAKDYLMYRNQARNSDRNSQAAMVIGFIILTGCVVIGVFLANMPSYRTFSTGAVAFGAVGTVFAAYISKMFNAARESALERYDCVSFRMELEDSFLRAERMVRDKSTITESEQAALMKILDARLETIRILLEEPNQIGDRFGTFARYRAALTDKGQAPRARRLGPASRPMSAIGMSPSRPNQQESIEAVLLQLASRLPLEGGTGPRDDEQDDSSR